MKTSNQSAEYILHYQSFPTYLVPASKYDVGCRKFLLLEKNDGMMSIGISFKLQR